MAKIDNSGIIFSDNSVRTSGNSTLNDVSGAPTNLSQFTNDLGNYGGFLGASNINQNYTYGVYGVDTHEYGYRYLRWDGSQLSVGVINCNCVCNC
jgi:hypothetical protein